MLIIIDNYVTSLEFIGMDIAIYSLKLKSMLEGNLYEKEIFYYLIDFYVIVVYLY